MRQVGGIATVHRAALNQHVQNLPEAHRLMFPHPATDIYDFVPGHYFAPAQVSAALGDTINCTGLMGWSSPIIAGSLASQS